MYSLCWNCCCFSLHSKAGIVEQFDGHYGPVTGIDYNAVPGPVGHIVDRLIFVAQSLHSW